MVIATKKEIYSYKYKQKRPQYKNTTKQVSQFCNLGGHKPLPNHNFVYPLALNKLSLQKFFKI